MCRKNHLYVAIAAFFLMILCAGASSAASVRERWEFVYTSGNQLDSYYDIEREKPYTTIWLLSDGRAFETGGSLYEWKTGNSSYTLEPVFSGDTKVFSLDSSTGGYVYFEQPGIHQSWRRTIGASSFRASISAERTKSFAVREEIVLDVSAVGSNAYTTQLYVINAATGQSVNHTFAGGGSYLYFFEEPGEYYAFATALDQETLLYSDCAYYAFTVGEAPETDATITSVVSQSCQRHPAAVNENTGWTLETQGGAGELTTVAYVVKDGEYLARYEFDGTDVTLFMEQTGSYTVTFRVRDEANGAYSPFTSASKRVVEQFDYEILEDENGVRTARLTGYNGHLKDLTLPSSFEGAPLTTIAPNAFAIWTEGVGTHNCDVVNLVVPEGVVTLEENAMDDCNYLENVALPSTLRTIGARAFDGCSHLTGVSLSSVEVIGDHAFDDCYGLTSFDFPDNLTSIGKYAFMNAPLDRIELPDSLTELGEYAFGSDRSGSLSTHPSAATYLRWTAGIPTVPKGLGCSTLKTLVIPEGVTAIEAEAFQYSSSLVDVQLPSTLTSLGRLAFGACRSLESIVLPDGLTTLEEYVFSQCSFLTNVTLPSNLTTLNNYVFSQTQVNKLELPDTLVNIGDYAFSGLDSSLTYLRWTAGVPEVSHSFRCFKALETVVLPEGVTSIKDSSNSSYGIFYDCDALKTIILPSTMQTIGKYAFYDCDGLITLSLTEGVKTLNDHAFQSCGALTKVTFPSSLTTVGSNVFFGCSSLTTVTMPEGLTTLGSQVFYGTKVARLELPDSLTTIGSSTFDSMDSLTYLRWTTGIPEVSYSFEGFKALETVELPEGVTSIKDGGIFKNCDALKTIILPSTMQTIGREAFYDCDALEEISISVSGVVLGDAAFSGCDALTTADLRGVESIGRSFENCTLLKTVSLGKGLTSIGANAFHGCPALARICLPNNITSFGSYPFSQTTTVVAVAGTATAAAIDQSSYNYGYTAPLTLTLPAALTTVKESAFVGNAAEMVVIPDGCTLIGDYAFANMEHLAYVQMPADVQVAENAFSGSPVIEMMMP